MAPTPLTDDEIAAIEWEARAYGPSGHLWSTTRVQRLIDTIASDRRKHTDDIRTRDAKWAEAKALKAENASQRVEIEALKGVVEAVRFYIAHGWTSHGNDCGVYKEDDVDIRPELCTCGHAALGESLRALVSPEPPK